MARKRQKQNKIAREIESALARIEAENKALAASQEQKRQLEKESKSDIDKMLEAINFIGDYLANFPTPKRATTR